MPLWLWVSLGLGVGYLLLGGSGGGTRPGSTSQGSVSARTDADFQKLWQVANDLGADPKVLGLILFEESGMDPGAWNSFNCVGCNQFCPGTYEGYVSVSREKYVTWSMAQQLDPIGRYWADKPKGGLDTARDLFWLSLWPKTWKPHADRSAVVVDNPAVVRANQNIAPGSSVITAGDVDDYLDTYKSSPGWQLALQRIAATDPSGVA
ncbi:MAG TPA: hypothetical protein VKR78_01070 [Acidimicrobiales bacterium]|nr:hypothetical protein [Acidimicrobiales bacterium]